MKDIDDKLTEILQEQTGHEFRAEVWNDAIAQIKQAFEEAGYIHLPQVELVERYERGKPTEYWINGKVAMTGQEWYERFVEEYVLVTETPSYSTKVIFEIAKRASGVEDE